MYNNTINYYYTLMHYYYTLTASIENISLGIIIYTNHNKDMKIFYNDVIHPLLYYHQYHSSNIR